MVFLGWLYLLAEWAIRVGMTPLVALRQKRPTASLAWLAVIYFLPVPGLIAYLLIGESRLGRRRLLRRLSRKQALASVRHLLVDAPGGLDRDVREDLTALAKMARRHGGLPVLPGNRVELMDRVEDMLDHLVADIDAAQRHVHLLFYIFRDDAAGRRVGEALARAAARGVQCRVLADDVGSRGFFSTLGDWLRSRGVRVIRVLPVNPLRSRFARLDIRNHRKVAVIDGGIAYAGSQNINEPTFGHRKAGVWRDITVRLAGPCVSQLQLVFIEDWFFETDEMLEAPDLYPVADEAGDASVQVAPTGPDQPAEGFQDLLSMAILTARRRAVITSPYFIPGEGLMQAIRLASARGVRVDLIVPDRSDHAVVDAASSYWCGQMLGHGVNVHLYQDGLLHAKTLTVDDDLALVGTANFDIRSFSLNLEVVLLLYDPASAFALLRLQERYMENAQSITLSDWQRRSRWRLYYENLAKLLSPLL